MKSGVDMFSMRERLFLRESWNIRNTEKKAITAE